MALSENAPDFWVAAAAAAPIIALAGLVAITDTAIASDIIKRARDENPELKGNVIRGKVEQLGPPTYWILIYNFFNVLIQGFVLMVALLALLQDGTPIPGIAIIVVEGIALLFLLLAAWLAGQIGAERERWKEALKPRAAEQLAEAIASEFAQLQLPTRSRHPEGGQGVGEEAL